MSADNGIYVLESKDGYRVKHTQAIENLYWWYTCCGNPDVKDIGNGNLFYTEKCFNCDTIDPKCEMKEEICPDRLKEIFGDCKVYSTIKEATEEAIRLYEEILNDDFCPIIEYGIQLIKYDKEFPK
ncbi:MAG: hypothetical protein PVG65_00025 [Candidatus Thorarchaeota archaeon]|jgi:hypothetical protein